MMNGNRAVNNLDEFNAQEMATPAAWLAALYAEYDSLFDSLEAVQQTLWSTRCFHALARKKLRRQRDDLCEALADVHEKLVDFDFVVM
ncbi:MAG: hypothetical protein ACXV2F_06085 [Halobacteriota archaeon]